MYCHLAKGSDLFCFLLITKVWISTLQEPTSALYVLCQILLLLAYTCLLFKKMVFGRIDNKLWFVTKYNFTCQECTVLFVVLFMFNNIMYILLTKQYTCPYIYIHNCSRSQRKDLLKSKTNCLLSMKTGGPKLIVFLQVTACILGLDYTKTQSFPEKGTKMHKDC